MLERSPAELPQEVGDPPPIKDGYNPATWVLEVSTPAQERRIGKDFADLFQASDLAKCVFFAKTHSCPEASSGACMSCLFGSFHLHMRMNLVFGITEGRSTTPASMKSSMW